MGGSVEEAARSEEWDGAQCGGLVPRRQITRASFCVNIIAADNCEFGTGYTRAARERAPPRRERASPRRVGRRRARRRPMGADIGPVSAVPVSRGTSIPASASSRDSRRVTGSEIECLPFRYRWIGSAQRNADGEIVAVLLGGGLLEVGERQFRYDGDGLQRG